MSLSQFHSTSVYVCLLIFQTSIRQGTGGNPLVSASCTGNPCGQARRTRRSTCPAENCSIFATSFHYFTLVSFRHRTGTTKSTECQEDTSGKNDSSVSQPLFLAEGHQVQHPSILSLPPSRQLSYNLGIPCYQHSKCFQHCSMLLNMPQFRTQEHLTEQGSPIQA